jgi:uncharacterized short protein YbdD (DUF466 family)
MRRETEREMGHGRRDAALPFPTRLARAVRRLIGAPDYGAYLEHCRAAGHAPGLTEKEYVKEFFDSKGTGGRCC